MESTCAGPYYDFTYEQATLEPPPPEAIQLFAAIYNSQAATEAFFGVFAQTIEPADSLRRPV